MYSLNEHEIELLIVEVEAFKVIALFKLIALDLNFYFQMYLFSKIMN